MRAVLSRSDVADFLARLADLQMHHGGAEMAACMTLPIAYYLPDRVLVFSSPENLAERFDTHRAYLLICRVKRIEARNLEMIDATPDRAFVRLEWHYLSKDDVTLRSAEVQYVLRRPPGQSDLRIELVDYSTLAFPQFMQTQLQGGRA